MGTKLTNVHDALSRAQEKAKNKVALVNANFKINPLNKEIAEQICVKNGTTMSEFLRECVDGLIEDYMGQKTFSELEEHNAKEADAQNAAQS